MSGQFAVRIGAADYLRLRSHLFERDARPHAAVLLVGCARSSLDQRLLVREVVLARDGIDYVPSTSGRGHHKLAGEFVRDAALRAHDNGLGYLAVHVHGGRDAVGFSPDDYRSHERGYPALLGVVGGQPVGALVMATNAVAGDIWLPDGQRTTIDRMTVIGAKHEYLRPRPTGAAINDPRYDRQARLLGDAGQALLGSITVGVVGAGGMGMLVTEYLSRLGVGSLVVIDPDRADVTNLPRLPGSRRGDARVPFQSRRWPEVLRQAGRRRAARKVDMAARLAVEANPRVRVDRRFGDVQDPVNAASLLDCDYIFLAANSDQARLLFNGIVHQYLIPGTQLGSKILVDKANGSITQVHSIARVVLPGQGCLWCNDLVSPVRLAEEAASVEQRRRQRYVDDPDVQMPSVITLNATAAAVAVNDFLFTITGLAATDAPADYTRFMPVYRDVAFDKPAPARPDCSECSPSVGRFALGDLGPRLPTRTANQR